MQPVRKATLIASVVLPILAIVTVFLRFYARRARKLALLADDWSVLLALLCTVVASILTCYGDISRGLGLGPVELNPKEAVAAFKIFYAIMLLVYLTFGIVKVSVILFYKRIFNEPQFRLVANIMMVIVVGWTIAQFIIQSLNSWNTPGFWNMRLLNYPIFNLTMAVLDFVFDIIILLLPLPSILKLHIDKKRKYALIGIFWLGAICVISSALRIYYTHAFLSIGPLTAEYWITYISSSNSLWLIVEANVSIIAACLPTLGGFLKVKLASTKHSSGSGRRYSMRKFSQPSERLNIIIDNDTTADRQRGNAWVPLHDFSVESGTVRENEGGADARLEHHKGIMVERTFASESLVLGRLAEESPNRMA